MSSWPDRPAVLVAALSGRAIAQAAWRAGYAPLVADLFGDLDTQEVATEFAVLPGSLSRRTSRAALLEALDRLAERRRPVGLVYGSGFEDRPALLDAMARRYGLLGNGAATVARLKQPFQFAALCRRCGAPHPQVRPAGPDGGEAWLVKRRGGSGGVHIRPPGGGGLRRGHYLQRRAPGRPVSALLLAGGRRAAILGYSAQWPAPTARHPFRYGGAVRPAAIPPPMAAGIAAALTRLAAEAELVGLNSADLLIEGDDFTLLEINPRPGASLDVYPDPRGTLFRAHVAGCGGGLPAGLPAFDGASAASVAYARRPILLPAGFAWPGWTADRQPPGRAVPSGAPFCTVLAQAETADAARALVLSRTAAILAQAEACMSPEAAR